MKSESASLGWGPGDSTGSQVWEPVLYHLTVSQSVIIYTKQKGKPEKAIFVLPIYVQCVCASSYTHTTHTIAENQSKTCYKSPKENNSAVAWIRSWHLNSGKPGLVSSCYCFLAMWPWTTPSPVKMSIFSPSKGRHRYLPPTELWELNEKLHVQGPGKLLVVICDEESKQKERRNSWTLQDKMWSSQEWDHWRFHSSNKCTCWWLTGFQALLLRMEKTSPQSFYL